MYNAVMYNAVHQQCRCHNGGVATLQAQTGIVLGKVLFPFAVIDDYKKYTLTTATSSKWKNTILNHLMNKMYTYDV